MTMGDLSPNFSKSEFACKCGCGFGAKDGDVSAGLVVLLEKIRQDVGGPVRLTSGCRCEKHNRDVGGVDHSVHTLGEAADIQVEGGRYRFMVAQSAFSHDAEGVGIAKGFVHVDVHDGSSKPRPSSWSY
jgi:uncharacterized protein YcbK (DUF882 family)